MKPKHVLLFGGSTSIYKKAKDLNILLSVVQEPDWLNVEDKLLIDKLFISKIDDKEILKNIYEYHKINPFDAVFSFLEDGLNNASIVKEELNIIGNNLNSVLLTKNKYLLRKKLEDYNEYYVPYIKYSNVKEVKSFISNNSNKVIIKPISSTGSRSIYQLENESQENIYKVINEIKFKHPNDEIIVEKFLEGKEYSVEAISINKKHKIISITEKTLKDNSYVEVTHYMPADISNMLYKKIEFYIINFLDIIDNENGPSHIEIMVNKDDIKIVEAHTRGGGGGISELIELVYNINIYEAIFEYVVSGREQIYINKNNKVAISHFFEFDKGYVENIIGYDELVNEENIHKLILNFKQGDVLKDVSNSSERHGNIIIYGSNKEEVYNILNNAMRRLIVEVEKENIR